MVLPGTAAFRAQNGGVALSNIGGDIRGATTNGGVTIDLGTITSSATEVTAINALNTQFQANAATRSAGLVATDNGAGDITNSSSGAKFRLNFVGGRSPAIP